MPRRTSKPKGNARRVKVSIARPSRRPFQLRYRCPETGKQVRVSTGSRDEEEAELQRATLEAELLLGRHERRNADQFDEEFGWGAFRELYSGIKLSMLRPKSRADAESRIDVAERIIRPKVVGDMLEPSALHLLQTRLLEGAQSRYGRPRSAATVRSYMKSILAMLNWGRRQRYFDQVPSLEFVKTDNKPLMKGRPLTDQEYERFLESILAIVGEEAEPSWRHLIEGVYCSGLRLAELMSLSWDIPQTIQPRWFENKRPTLWFPAHAQKNNRSEEIPLCPWMEELLNQTAECNRKGWVFNPLSLQYKAGRKPREQRLSAEQVGKIISRIGKASEIVVDEGNPRTGSPPKFASAHDLRRTFAQRLTDANLPPKLVSQLMRHADPKTTQRYYITENIQRDARRIHDVLNER